MKPAEEGDCDGEWSDEVEAGAEVADGEEFREFPCGAEGDECAECGEECGGSAEILVCGEECDECRDEQAGHEESPAKHKAVFRAGMVCDGSVDDQELAGDGAESPPKRRSLLAKSRSA